jgi:hypothetical protein
MKMIRPVGVEGKFLGFQGDIEVLVRFVREPVSSTQRADRSDGLPSTVNGDIIIGGRLG